MTDRPKVFDAYHAYSSQDVCDATEVAMCIEELEQRIAELEAERQWISEEEQKPASSALVLVDCRGVVGTGHYHQDLDDWFDTPNERRPDFWRPIPAPAPRNSDG